MFERKDGSFRGTIGHGVAVDTKALAENGTFEGYASTYGNVDQGRDIVRYGAFDASLRTRPAGKIKMLCAHDTDRLCGVWTAVSSDTKGLFVRGKLLLTTELGRDTYEQIKAGALDAMSIGYRVMEDEYDSAASVRTITRADLLEVSLVAMPMNDQALITSVKSLDIDGLETLSDAERLLRDAGRSFSRKEALDFVSRVKRIAQREAGDDQSDNRALRKLADTIRSSIPK